MRKVERSEIVDFATYGDQREATRKTVLETKRVRRVHVGEYLTFLFENADTIRYQIQEIMRAERIVRETDVLNEIATYNALLGDEGELGCVLLIEIDDKAERDQLLRRGRRCPSTSTCAAPTGARSAAQFDRSQIGEEKISSVQYLKFAVGTGIPVAVGSDHPELNIESWPDRRAARRPAGRSRHRFGLVRCRSDKRFTGSSREPTRKRIQIPSSDPHSPSPFHPRTSGRIREPRMEKFGI